MRKKIVIYAGVIAVACSLNVYYYWNTFWTIWAKHYIQDQDIVISLTTTPYRINAIEGTMQSLSRQNIPIRQIYVNVPHVFRRDNVTYNIPDWLDVYPNVTILRTEDYGPATKLLGTLEKGELKTNTIIITVDDDTIYPKHMALRLAVRAKQHPHEAVGTCGANLEIVQNEPQVVKIQQDKAHTDILEGFAGIAYRARFFDTSIFDIKSEPDFCYNSDDLYLSFQLAKNNIPRQTVTNKYTSVFQAYFRQLGYGFGPDALYLLDQNSKQSERYLRCATYLNAKYPDVALRYHDDNA